MMTVLAIALGGALGAVSRYGVGLLALQWFGRGWPWGTLAINISGSLLMGFVFALIIRHGAVHQDWQPITMVGFLGAFTTYSTFALETVVLLEADRWLAAVSYALASVGGCVLAALAGLLLARLLL